MIVSIITVCFNSVKSIEKTILSVINQDYDKIEYIIIDGKSTDGTISIITKYQNRIKTWLSEPDQGIYDAMNKGINKATGDIVYFLNSDDYFINDCVISKVVKYFNSNEPIGLLYGRIFRYTGANSKIVFEVELSDKNLKRGIMPSHQSLFVKKNVFESLGSFDLTFKSAADLEFLCRLQRHHVLTKQVSETIAYYSIEGYSNFSNKGITETMQIIKKYYGTIPYLNSVLHYVPIMVFRYVAKKLGFLIFYRTKIYPKLIKMN